MTHHEIRKKFIDFFEKRGHKIVPSSSLLPDDPSVLFTTAGMQQFKKYYIGRADPMKDFGSLNTASIQKSMRTSDIDEVGGGSHLTFFEMLGNFSFGGYWKKEAIEYAMTFLVDKKDGIGIDLDRIYVTYFAGDKELPGITVDIESKVLLENTSFFKNRIKKGGKDNFWGPTGLEGPCGPTIEFYIDGIEIWNLVFNEFYCEKSKEYKPLDKKYRGVDTGMGLERLAMVSQKVSNIFETDLFSPIFKKLPEKLPERIKRIIIDHSRAVAFLISDGIRPSNKEQGYVLRRLIRRIIVFAYQENIQTMPEKILETLETIVEVYKTIKDYQNLDLSVIKEVYNAEYAKFIKSVGSGLKELDKLKSINAQSAFKLYESFGLPYETIREAAGLKAKGLTREAFDEEFKKHQQKSRVGVEKKFKNNL